MDKMLRKLYYSQVLYISNSNIETSHKSFIAVLGEDPLLAIKFPPFGENLGVKIRRSEKRGRSESIVKRENFGTTVHQL